MKFFWSKQTRIFLSEGPNLDILWVFRDEVGSVRTRIVDLMTVRCQNHFFIRYLRISDLPTFHRKILLFDV